VNALPPGLRPDAAESIGGTLAALGAAGPRAGALQQAANDAFVHAMHVTALCAVFAVLLGSAVVWLFLPGRRASGGSVETGQSEIPAAGPTPADQPGADQPGADRPGADRPGADEPVQVAAGR
jgi:DHA2 family integral membrane protein (MFS transporter)